MISWWFCARANNKRSTGIIRAGERGLAPTHPAPDERPIQARDCMSKNQARKPLEIKISTVVAVAALIGDTDYDKLSSALGQLTAGTPDYFEDEFTLLDFVHLSPALSPGQIDWPRLIALFKSHRLNPVAVRNVPACLEDEIRTHGLNIDHVDTSRQFELTPPPSPPAPDTAAEEKHKAVPATAAPATVAAAQPVSTMVVDTPVRGGQRIYARGCDLVLTAAVNAGAEVIADGSIHIYAPLRGRALAGAAGNAQARIFSLSMEAELVSIAGVYRTFDEGWPKNLSGKPVQIRLRDERLDMVPIELK
jgi:septum site-determining protein MinC